MTMLKAIDLKPEDASRWHDGIPILLAIGDLEGYRRRLSQELDRFKDTTNSDLAHRVVKDALALPIEGEELHIAQELAERAVANPNAGWGPQTKGMAEYRLGHYREKRSPGWPVARRAKEWACSKTIADLFMAMSYQQLADEAQARAALHRATQKMDREFPKAGTDDITGANDWVLCQVLRRRGRRARSTTKHPRRRQPLRHSRVRAEVRGIAAIRCSTLDVPTADK